MLYVCTDLLYKYIAKLPQLYSVIVLDTLNNSKIKIHLLDNNSISIDDVKFSTCTFYGTKCVNICLDCIIRD